MSSTPIRKNVFEYLRHEILRGQLNNGERLIETEIAKKLRTSRTPVREAFRKLENEGLVEYAAGRGVTVTRFSSDDIRELYEIRSALEGLASQLAAKRITEDQIRELKSLIKEMAVYFKKKNLRHVVQLHTVFNEAIYRAAGNRRLHELANRFHEYTEKSQLRSLTVPGRFQAIQEEHRRIVRALERGDPEKAERAVKTHVQQAQAAYMKSFELWGF